jgi:hypothetical protein
MLGAEFHLTMKNRNKNEHCVTTKKRKSMMEKKKKRAQVFPGAGVFLFLHLWIHEKELQDMFPSHVTFKLKN